MSLRNQMLLGRAIPNLQSLSEKPKADRKVWLLLPVCCSRRGAFIWYGFSTEQFAALT